MLKSDIKRAYDLVVDEGSYSSIKRLVLAVKASAKGRAEFSEVVQSAIEDEYGAQEAARLNRGGDMVPGFLIHAESVAQPYYLFEADLASLLVDAKGDVVGYYHTGREATIRPEDMTLRGAACVDDNSEAHQDIMACARALVYGSGGGRNGPYYAERTGRRYNPRRR